jgi:hypothetical protein
VHCGTSVQAPAIELCYPLTKPPLPLGAPCFDQIELQPPMIQRVGRTPARRFSLEAIHFLGRRGGFDAEALAGVEKTMMSICTSGGQQTREISVRPKYAAGEAAFRTIVIYLPCLKR